MPRHPYTRPNRATRRAPGPTSRPAPIVVVRAAPTAPAAPGVVASNRPSVLAVVESVRAYGRPLTAVEVEKELSLREGGAYPVQAGRFRLPGVGVRWDHEALADAILAGSTPAGGRRDRTSEAACR